MIPVILEDSKEKKIFSEYYNSVFNKETGNFMRWGKDKEDNPVYSQFGPEIADIEITTSCSGPKGVPCPFCYKGNTKNGKNMTFETFKGIFHKLPRTIQQIAFGADADLSSNPDIWKIMDYCRNNDYQEVIPNITVADVSDEVAQKLSKTCGAVAVSRYADKNICYDSVKKLTDLGMKQVNIHMMVSLETYEQVLETIYDIKKDHRLKDLNAIVFLSLKQKGRGTRFNKLLNGDFKRIVYLSFINKVRFGFDSCGCNKFLDAVKDFPNYKELEEMAEPCESTLFSTYIDVDGNFFPCSFCEKVEGWDEGISVIDSKDFLEDIWFNERTIEFREKLLKGKRSCPIYNV